MFGRKKKQVEPPQVTVEEEDRPLPHLGDEDPIWSVPGPRAADEVDTSKGYVDMGSLMFPAVPGMQLQTQMGPDGKTIQKIMIVLGTSGLYVQVAAAPKSGGVWEGLREQIRAGIEQQGGSVEQVEGRYGPELHASLAVTLPNGSHATSPMRIIGREGPRWFTRLDIIGPAANNEEQARPIERLIDAMVIVRDDQPRARLDMLPLHIPNQAVEAPSV